MSGNSGTQFRVLDVGQCDLDHGNISRLVEEHFNASVDRAHDRTEALAKVTGEAYDLVLVNRLLDRDHSEGLDVIREIKADAKAANVPVMLVSNFEDAQAAAVSEGALQGFGKDSLGTNDTLAILRSALRNESQNV